MDDVTSHDLTVGVNPIQKRKEEKEKMHNRRDIFRVTHSKGRISTSGQFSFSEGKAG